MNENEIEKRARLRHFSDFIWSELPEDRTIKDFRCSWEDLTEEQRDFYLAFVVEEELIIRLTYSPFRLWWRFYYNFVDW